MSRPYFCACLTTTYLYATVICASFLTVLIFDSSSSAVLAQQQTKTMLVFDSSRSMWGQIEGRNKVVIMHKVLAKSFKDYDGKLKLGLMSYGHRKAAGCGDIELIEKPRVLSADDFTKKVNKTRPKGSTPIAKTLKLAAQSVIQGGRGNIILLADGLDNCSGDPCAVAGSLKQNAPQFTIHVVAFSKTEKEKLKALQCLSEATGGTFSSAANEEELQRSVDSAFSSVAAAQQNSLTTSALAPAPGLVVQPNSVDLANTAALQGQVTPEQSGGIALNQITQTLDPAQLKGAQTPQIALAPQTTGALSAITLSAHLIDGGKAIQSGLVWRIFDARANAQGKYKLLSTHRDALPTAALSPGEYLVNAAYGRAYLTKTIEVKPGQPKREEFVLNAGGLRLGAVLANGQPISPQQVSYSIFKDERDQFGNREKVIARARPGLIIRLNAGIYHIVSLYGNANAVVNADVTVEPGKLTEATINHSAAAVTFKLVSQPGGEALANTQWRILTEAGDLVKTSAGAIPTHILAAGNYVVLAKYGGQDYKRQFVVRPGDVMQIEVVIQ